MTKDTLESIRKEILVATEDLLTVHAAELDTAINMLDGVVKLNLSVIIDTREAKTKVTTKLSFHTGQCKDERESFIDDGQPNLFE